MDNYPKAYREVYEILKYIPKEDVQKIPKDLLETIEKNMDKEYEYKIDITKSFEEQKTLQETKAIISIIYKDYWATEKRRKELNQIRRNQRETIEQEKREKYDVNNIFKEKEFPKQVALIETQKTNAFVKLINKIKSWFK